MVEAFKQWRVYVEGAAHPVRVFTDHKNLEYFCTTKTTSRRHARWAATLAAYNYAILYRKGASNGQPDALSQRSDHLPSEVQTPSSTHLLFSALRCWYRLTIPSSFTLLQPTRGMQPSLRLSNSSRGGLAGSQTPPCQGASRRAGQRRTPTPCSTAFSTVAY